MVTTKTRRLEVNRRSGWQSWLGPFFTSDVGMKWMMALTGIGLLGYILVHMIGNLKIFIGPEDLDHYAESLRTLLYPIFPKEGVLWLFRIGLSAMAIIHIWSATVLALRNRKARGSIRYEKKREYAAADYASRTMLWGGVLIALFVLYHLADLTIGSANPDYVAGDVYNNVVYSFERWPVALFYLVTMVFLALHIYHGAWSLFQSLGMANPRYDVWRRYLAVALALAILIGNSSIPIAVQLGILTVSG
ncbi:MAG: succinate dehydrogenase cytochrome b subunit [Acidimicrobiia bacterium]|jgi:succinate dehydrogenase / fumarate reductase cytochrome b subunit